MEYKQWRLLPGADTVFVAPNIKKCYQPPKKEESKNVTWPLKELKPRVAWGGRPPPPLPHHHHPLLHHWVQATVTLTNTRM